MKIYRLVENSEGSMVDSILLKNVGRIDLNATKPKDLLSFCRFYHNIGKKYFNRDQLKIAETLLQSALEILEHLDLAGSKIHSVITFDVIKTIAYQDRYRKAINLALDLQNKYKTQNLPEDALLYDLYFWIAMILSSQEDYQKAEEYYNRFISAKNQLYPVDSIPLANAYNNLSYVYLKLRKNQNALTSINKAFDIYFARKNISPSTIARAYWRRGIVHGNLANSDSAVYYYNLAIQLLEREELKTSPIYPIILKNFGDFFIKIHDLEKAKLQYQKGITPTPIKNNLYLGGIYYGLSKVSYIEKKVRPGPRNNPGYHELLWIRLGILEFG